MELSEFIEKTINIEGINGHEYQNIRPRIVCSNGVSLSVQASDGHYCSPRVNGIKNYHNVEVGYPSIRPPISWEKYYDGEWQKPGILGWLKRVWSRRSSIAYGIKSILKYNNSFERKYIKWLLSKKDNATDGVYGYIPVELVEGWIDQNGGIDTSATFQES